MEKDVFKQELWNSNNKLKPLVKKFFIEESQVDLTKLIWQDSLVTEHLKSLVRLKNIKNKMQLQKKSSQKGEATKPHVNKILLGTDLHKKMMQERYIQLNKARLAAKLPLLRVNAFKKNLKSLSVYKKIVHLKKVNPVPLKKKIQVSKKRPGSWFLKFFKKKIHGLRQFSVRFQAAGQIFNMLKLPPIKKKVFKNNSSYRKKGRFQSRAALKLNKKFVKTKLSNRSRAVNSVHLDVIKLAVSDNNIEKSSKPLSSFVANTNLIQNLVLQQNWLLKSRIVPPAKLLSRWGSTLYDNKLVGNIFVKIDTLDKLYHLFRLNVKSTNSLRDKLVACRKIEKNYDPKTILEDDDFSTQVVKFLKTAEITKIGGPVIWKIQKRRYFRSLLLKLLRGRRTLVHIKKKRKKRKILSLYYPGLLRIFDGRLSYVRLRFRVAKSHFFKLIKNTSARCPRLLSWLLNLNYFINKPKFKHLNTGIARGNSLIRNIDAHVQSRFIKSKIRSIFFLKLQLINCKPMQPLCWIKNAIPTWKIISWNHFFSLYNTLILSSINYSRIIKSVRASRNCTAIVDAVTGSIASENRKLGVDYNLENNVEMDILYPYGGRKWALTSLTVDAQILNYFENIQAKSGLNLEMGFDEQMVAKSLDTFTAFEPYNNNISWRDIYAVNFYLYWKNIISFFIEKSYIFVKNSQNSLALLRGVKGSIGAWPAIEQIFKKRLGQFYCLHFYKCILIHTKLQTLKISNFNYFFDFYLSYKKKAILLLRRLLRRLLMRRRWVWPTWWFFLRYRERSSAWKKIKAFWLTPRAWYDAGLTSLPILNLIMRFKTWKYIDHMNKRFKLKKRPKLTRRRSRKLGWFAPAIWNNLSALVRASVRLASYVKKIKLFIRKLAARHEYKQIKLKKSKAFIQIFYNHVCDYQKQKIKILKNISVKLWTQMKLDSRIRRLFKTIKFKKVKAKKNKIWLYTCKLRRLNFKCKALEPDLLNTPYSLENWTSSNSSEKERRLVRNSWVPPAEWVLIPDKFRKKIVRNSYKKLLKRHVLKKKFYRKFLWKRRNYKIINSEEYKMMIKNLKISASKRRELLVWKHVRAFGPQNKILNKFERCARIIARIPAVTKIKSNTKNDKKIQKH